MKCPFFNMCIYYKDDCWEKGNKPDSIRIWNPLHIPKTSFPAFASFIIDSIIGENRAIAPVRK